MNWAGPPGLHNGGEFAKEMASMHHDKEQHEQGQRFCSITMGTWLYLWYQLI